MNPRRLKRAAGAAVLVAAGAVAGLLAVEGLFDVFHGLLPRDLRVMWIRRAALPATVGADAELGYSLTPGFSAEFANGAGVLRVTHAAYPACPRRAFRGSPEQVRAGVDVALVGDSIAYGVEVDQDATMAAQLQRISGKTVANLAVTGYGTAQELILYRECGAALRPKLVLFEPFLNDPLDNRDFERWRREGALQGLPLAKWCMILGVAWPSPACTALTFLDKRFTLADILVHRLSRRTKLSSLDDPALAGPGVDAMCGDAGRLRDLTRGQGARLALVFPEHWTRAGPGGRAALARLLACSKDLGLPALDLGVGDGPGPETRGALDAHWTEAGHRAAAERTWRFIEERGLLPR